MQRLWGQVYLVSLKDSTKASVTRAQWSSWRQRIKSEWQQEPNHAGCVMVFWMKELYSMICILKHQPGCWDDTRQEELKGKQAGQSKALATIKCRDDNCLEQCSSGESKHVCVYICVCVNVCVCVCVRTSKTEQTEFANWLNVRVEEKKEFNDNSSFLTWTPPCRLEMFTFWGKSKVGNKTFHLGHFTCEMFIKSLREM